MSCLYVKTFHSHIQPTVRRLICNHDTAVIIRLNNSLSSDLSKNVPMMCRISFRLSSSPLFRSINSFFLSSLSNELYYVHENSENYCFLSVSSKASKVQKAKADRIDPIARNKGCRITVTERPSSRLFSKNSSTGSLPLLRIFFIFNVYPSFGMSPLRPFYKSISH